MIAVETNQLQSARGRDNPDDRRGLQFIAKPLLFILLLWIVFWADSSFMLGLYEYGILPRHPEGLLGILSSPFIHGSLTHLSNNSIPLLMLGMGLFYFYPRIAGIVILVSWLLSGLIVWVIGRENYHIGASGLIYSWAAFIFLSGLLRRQPQLLALSLLVVFLYGSLVWGVFPLKDGVSWEAHLAGGISGFLLAIRYRKMGPRPRRYSWEEPDMEEPLELEEGEDEPTDAWQTYSESRHGIHYVYRERKGKTDA